MARVIVKAEGGKSAADVGKLYKKHATQDYQNRGDDAPRSGIPVDIIGGSYKSEAFMELTFSRTSERDAQRWTKQFLAKNNLPFSRVESGQDGDHRDDWVIAYVYYDEE